MSTKKNMRMTDFMTVDNEDLAARMEIFEKLEDCICNYENIAALYGMNDREARETLFRGVRNAFYYGVMYERNNAREIKEME